MESKELKPGWLYVAVAVILGLLAVMGQEFADQAKTPFWWNFWAITGVVSAVIILVVWAIYFFKRDKN